MNQYFKNQLICVAAALLLAAGTVAQATPAGDQAQVFADAEIQAMLKEIEDTERVRAKRLSLCRSAPDLDAKFDLLVANAIAKDKLVGPKTEILERCLFYIHGKQDELRSRNDRLKQRYQISE